MIPQELKSIGIYGGSFNPVHFGHLNLALEMLEKGGMDEVWFCPANASPHKLNELPISSQHRLEMLKLALEGVPNCCILESELHRPFPSYTIDTIEELLDNEKMNPLGHKFFLLIGEDSLQSFPQWHRANELVQLIPLLIARRNRRQLSLAGDEDPNSHAGFQRSFVETRTMEISSSEIRQRLAQGKCCLHLLPKKVLDYIEEYDLY